MESVGVQCSPISTDAESQMEAWLVEDGCVQTEGVNTLEAESQTAFKGVDASLQTLEPVMAESGIQVKLSFGSDSFVQTDSKEFVSAGSQTVFVSGRECSVQTIPLVNRTLEQYSQTQLPEACNTGSQTEQYVQTQLPEACNTGSQTELPRPCDDAGSQTIVVDPDGSRNIVVNTGSQTFVVEARESGFQTPSTQTSETSSQTRTISRDTHIQTEPNTTTSIHSQTILPTCLAMASQTNFIGRDQCSQTLLPSVITTSSQTEGEMGGQAEGGTTPPSPPVIVRQPSESGLWPLHSVSSSSSSNQGEQPQLSSSPTSSGVDLEGQVVALKAAVLGLETQLRSERDSHRREMSGLEREIKHVQRSIGGKGDTEVGGEGRQVGREGETEVGGEGDTEVGGEGRQRWVWRVGDRGINVIPLSNITHAVLKFARKGSPQQCCTFF